MAIMTTPGKGSGAAAGTATTVLDCRGLRKSFGEVLAVADLSLHVRAGETYGLLGPNGAGKTTAISLIAGILTPDDGEVVVGGEAMTVRATQVKRHIGYVPQEVALYPDLTGRENLHFFARLYGLSRAGARARAGEVLEVVGLTDRGGDRVDTYSGGMRRRLNIGIGLLHRPSLLILDEPTVGVDPQSRNAILTSVEALGAEGLAVLYTTHYMEEAERLCDRVGVIDLGRLIAEGTVRELTALVGEHDRVWLAAAGDLESAARRLREVAAVHEATVRPDGIGLTVADARAALPTLLQTASGHAVVRAVDVTEPDLEAVFLHLTGKSLRD